MSDLAARLVATKDWQGGVGMTPAEHEAMVADLIRTAIRECARVAAAHIERPRGVAGINTGQIWRFTKARAIHAAILALIGEETP